MAIEIERKYLVIADRLPRLQHGERIVQAYIPTANRSTVRVRLCDARAYLTLKGPNEGISRSEFEYHIPLEDAQEILAGLCAPQRIEKTRYNLMHKGMLWEVDVFEGANAGLMLAEIELPSEATEFETPGWVGTEVSSDLRYSNQALMRAPWPLWASED